MFKKICYTVMTAAACHSFYSIAKEAIKVLEAMEKDGRDTSVKTIYTDASKKITAMYN